MKKTLIAVLSLLVLWTASGCSNGPFRQFFKGGACSSCNPPFGLFNRKQHTVGTCSDGTCSGVTPVDGTMLGGPAFGSGVAPATQSQPPVGADTYPYPGTTNPPGSSISPSTEAPLPGIRGGGQ